MTIRRKDDQSLVCIHVCRHAVPAVGTVSASVPCPEHRVPDCLMRFWALSWLQETARGDSRRDWDDRWGEFTRERRESKVLTVKACRYTGEIGDSCAEHSDECIDTFVAAIFIAGYAMNKARWRAFRDELVNNQLPGLLAAACPA